MSRKFAMLNIEDGCYLSCCLICIEENMIDLDFSPDPEDIFYFPNLKEAVALLNYLQTVCKSDIVQKFVVVELEI